MSPQPNRQWQMTVAMAARMLRKIVGSVEANPVLFYVNILLNNLFVCFGGVAVWLI
jgi:hypothetical protein